MEIQEDRLQEAKQKADSFMVFKEKCMLAVNKLKTHGDQVKNMISRMTYH